MSLKKIASIGAAILPFALYALWLAYPIDLRSIDLGRLLMTGEVFLRTPELRSALLHTNFFTYTNPDFAIVNHHWLSAVIFRLLFKFGGFVPLHLLYITMELLAFGIYYRIALRYSPRWIVFAISLPLILLLSERYEIRPEGFAYLISALMVWILTSYSSGNLNAKWLWLLPVFIVLWVNVHVSFPIGLLIIGAWTTHRILEWKNDSSKKVFPLVTVIAISALATIINPAGIAGALYPFAVIQNHGILIAENQPILFLQSIGFTNASFFIVELVTVLLACAIVLLVKTRRISAVLPLLLISIPICILAWFGARHVTFLGFFLLPTLSAVIAELLDAYELSRESIVPNTIGTILVFSAVIGCVLNIVGISQRPLSLGLISNVESAAAFMVQHEIPGPIFNDFDNAGYLTYYLFPQEKTFVDNRPEAHPADFFEKVYIPMFEKENVWQAGSDLYKFNTIVINYKDRAEWIAPFIRARLADPKWVPVFADDALVIFVRNTAFNALVISSFRMDPDSFQF